MRWAQGDVWQILKQTNAVVVAPTTATTGTRPLLLVLHLK
jgi:hypothetical protein